MTDTRYKDKTYIGSGGMASVYKAFDETLHRWVAVKEMAEQLRDNEDVRSLFLKEARKMASIRHQNVVQVYDVIDDGEVPTIIMEFMDGGSLASRLGLGALQAEEVLDILRQIVSGLQAIHSAGVVHRDLKPENILEDQGLYKITDFGVAMSGDEETVPFVTSKYAAPEVLIDPGKIAPSSDLYSLGIMAIELLLGHRRFEEVVKETIEGDQALQLPAIKGSAQAFWQQWVASKASLPPLDKLDPSISPELGAFLAKLTDRNQANRPQDCQSVLDDLRDLERIERQRAGGATEYDPKMKRQMDKKKAQGDQTVAAGKKKQPLWFKLVAGFGGLALLGMVALLLLPSGPPRFHLDVVTDPPGASVTVNGQLLEDDPTPTWFNGAWGDTVIFQVDGEEPLEVVLAEGMDGLTETEEGMRLELGWSKPLRISSSAEAAAVLAESLPRAWALEVYLDGVDPQDGIYSVPVGAPLRFQAISERAGSLAMMHLGSDDSLTLIYPDPKGVATWLEAQEPAGVGAELGLEAREPLGHEWFVFLVREDPLLPPPIEGVETIADKALRYPFGGEASPDESPGRDLVLWLLDSVADDNVSTTLVETEVVQP